MVPERVLVAGAAVALVVSGVAATAVPGVISAPTEPVRPGVVGIEEMTIAPGAVSGRTATLSVETRLAHRGGPAENVSVLLRATDLESGFVASRRTLDVAPIRDDREVAVIGNLTVEREGGYRIETIAFQDGRRVAQGARTVRGVGELQPPRARTAIEFHRFGDGGAAQPVIEYSIAAVGNDTTTLGVSTYLTNAGDEPAGGLRLTLAARQAESNIVADEADVTVRPIAPGRTATPTARLTVPTDYNYYLDALLWKDGVVVGSARSTASLDPAETLSVNRTRREIGLEVGDFERGSGGEKTPRPDRTAATAPAAGQPGFTAGAVIVALLAAAALLGRRSG